MNIIEALKKLDPADDNHWTAEGLSRLDTVRMIAEDPAITRDAIEAAAPAFTRANAADYDFAAAAAAQAGDKSKGNTNPNPFKPADATAQNEAVNATVETQTGTETVEGEEVVDLEAALAAAERYTAEVKADLFAMEQEFKEAQAAEDAIRVKLHKAGATQNNEAIIRDYLDRQLEEYAAKQKVADELAAAGINLKALQAAANLSPLDAALAARK
nr:MAG TPA: hypothetical protein [Caudoviricetes sp.]